MPPHDKLDALLASALNATEAPWSENGSDKEFLVKVEKRIRFHGIAALLDQQHNQISSWPAKLKEQLRHESVGRAMWEHTHRQKISELLEQLHSSGVESRVLKGTAIAYSNYVEPFHRIRGDSDILIFKTHLNCARGVLSSLGFGRPFHGQGPFGELHYQETWRYIDPAGLNHDVDLHWEVTNSRALRKLLDINLFMAEALPLPRLSPFAMTVGTETRLIHGFVNRCVHAMNPFYVDNSTYYDAGRLIWAQDYHLQADSLSEEGWVSLVQRCCDLGIARLALGELKFAEASKKTKIPPDVRKLLEDARHETRAINYIKNWGSPRRALEDFKATPGLLEKVRFLLARAFPAPAHVQAKYVRQKNWPLPLLYLLRHAEAVGQFVKRAINR